MVWSTCKIVTQIHDTTEFKNLNEFKFWVLPTTGRSKHNTSLKEYLERTLLSMQIKLQEQELTIRKHKTHTKAKAPMSKSRQRQKVASDTRRFGVLGISRCRK